MAKRVRRDYFTQETEDAIILHNATTDTAERERIYTRHIHKPFKKIAEIVVQKWQCYHVDEGYESELVLHMWMNLAKFDPTQGKAFTYFTVISRNKAWKDNKDNYDKLKNNDDAEVADESDVNYHRFTLNDYEQEQELIDYFTDDFIESIEDRVQTLFVGRIERLCADAILTVLKRRFQLDKLDKRTLPIYVREIADISENKYGDVFKIIQKEFIRLYENYIQTGQFDPTI